MNEYLITLESGQKKTVTGKKVMEIKYSNMPDDLKGETFRLIMLERLILLLESKKQMIGSYVSAYSCHKLAYDILKDVDLELYRCQIMDNLNSDIFNSKYATLLAAKLTQLIQMNQIPITIMEVMNSLFAD